MSDFLFCSMFILSADLELERCSDVISIVIYLSAQRNDVGGLFIGTILEVLEHLGLVGVLDL